MFTLGEFLGLIDNFYSENSLIKVFDIDKTADDSYSLADDTIGCVFGIVPGEAKGFLNSVYENAEVVSIYIGKRRELRVLIDTHSDEDTDDVQADLINKRSDLRALNEENEQ